MDAMVVLASVLLFVVGASVFAMGFAGGFTWWQVLVGLLLMSGAIAGDMLWVQRAKKS